MEHKVLTLVTRNCNLTFFKSNYMVSLDTIIFLSVNGHIDVKLLSSILFHLLNNKYHDIKIKDAKHCTILKKHRILLHYFLQFIASSSCCFF